MEWSQPEDSLGLSVASSLKPQNVPEHVSDTRDVRYDNNQGYPGIF